MLVSAYRVADETDRRELLKAGDSEFDIEVDFLARRYIMLRLEIRVDAIWLSR
jgi:hypothetical protein